MCSWTTGISALLESRQWLRSQRFSLQDHACEHLELHHYFTLALTVSRHYKHASLLILLFYM
jgi:hypothetical protein